MGHRIASCLERLMTMASLITWNSLGDLTRFVRLQASPDPIRIIVENLSNNYRNWDHVAF
jgi:hypothetical protein